MGSNIPKVINYFWFGGNPEPTLVKECISSWKKFCPDYKIKRWDESNFDINICNYVKEAYEAKKWAFVSDYARFYILNKYGGVYLDTDVELIKSIDGIVQRGPFFACEEKDFKSVNPGLGMATQKNNDLYSRILADYNCSHFITRDGLYDETPVGDRIVNKFLLKDGLKDTRGIQRVDNIYIYPKEYFCPYSNLTGRMDITSNTIAIHHFAASWWSDKEKSYRKIGQKVSNFFGAKVGLRVEQIIRFPISFKQKYKKIGFKQTFRYYLNKYLKIRK